MRGRRAQVETVEQTLQAEEIRYIPGTQGDTLKAVQNLPGVARAPFGIGLLPVWGSSPADTRVYVDGINIPTLYHFGGLRSTVNSEMVDALHVRARRLPGRPRPAASAASSTSRRAGRAPTACTAMRSSTSSTARRCWRGR